MAAAEGVADAVIAGTDILGGLTAGGTVVAGGGGGGGKGGATLPLGSDHVSQALMSAPQPAIVEGSKSPSIMNDFTTL